MDDTLGLSGIGRAKATKMRQRALNDYHFVRSPAMPTSNDAEQHHVPLSRSGSARGGVAFRSVPVN